MSNKNTNVININNVNSSDENSLLYKQLNKNTSSNSSFNNGIQKLDSLDRYEI